MMRAVVAGIAALLAVPAAAACSSSGGTVARSSAPVTSASTVSTPPPSTTSTPSPSPSSSAPAPLSPYESDPAVRALRLFGAAGARAISAGKVTTPAFDATMAPALRKDAKYFTGDERGLQYPGPLPFTPVRVRVRSSSERDVRLCIVSAGFAVSPRTHKPVAKRTVQAIDAAAVRQNGLWVVSKFAGASFSCSGVTIKEPTWAQS